MPERRWPFGPIHPVALTVAFVLSSFAATSASANVLARPLLVACLLAVALTIVTALLTRSPHVGGLVALLAILALLDMLPLLIVTAIGLFSGIFLQARGWSIPWTRVTRAMNLVGVITMVLATASALQGGALDAGGRQAGGVHERAYAERAVGPDVYLLLLDGYPRADTLRERFGFDNNPFLEALNELGFAVAEEAHVNYNATDLTIATMLDVRHADAIPGLAPATAPAAAQGRSVGRAAARGRAVEAFRKLGYEIVTVSSPVSDVTLWSADRVIDSGGITNFELDLMQAGNLPSLLPDLQRKLLADSLRDRIVESFRSTAALAAERGGSPKFVLTHVMSPHAPILFDATGRDVQGWACFPSSCSAFDGGYRYGDERKAATIGQITHLNGLVLDTVRGIQSGSDKPPVVVVFSDHGSRFDLDDAQEMLRSLLATSTPGHPELIPNDATPINLLGRLLRAYHGVNLPWADEDLTYVVAIERSPTEGVLDLTPIIIED